MWPFVLGALCFVFIGLSVFVMMRMGIEIRPGG